MMFNFKCCTSLICTPNFSKKNSVLTVFIIVKVFDEIFISCSNCLFGTKLNKTFDECNMTATTLESSLHWF